MRVTLVSAAHCHLCAHAMQVLERLRREVPIEVMEIDWESDRGAALARRDGVPFPPALYAGEDLIGYGRLSDRALRRRLLERKR